MKSNPNPSFYSAFPYESLSSHASIDKKINEKKMKRKMIIRKENVNIDLAVLPSHDIIIKAFCSAYLTVSQVLPFLFLNLIYFYCIWVLLSSTFLFICLWIEHCTLGFVQM